MTASVLVAGIGNIFFSDDGFGPAVAARLLSPPRAAELPDTVRVVDYGIRGMHLVYDLLEGVDAFVVVDVVPRTPSGDPPGTVTVLEIGSEDIGDGVFDAHGMSPVSVLASLEPMGGTLPPTYLVGCVAANVSEGIGLSEPVTAAVEHAAAAVLSLTRALCSGAAPVPLGQGR